MQNQTPRLFLKTNSLLNIIPWEGTSESTNTFRNISTVESLNKLSLLQCNTLKNHKRAGTIMLTGYVWQEEPFGQKNHFQYCKPILMTLRSGKTFMMIFLALFSCFLLGSQNSDHCLAMGELFSSHRGLEDFFLIAPFSSWANRNNSTTSLKLSPSYVLWGILGDV